MSAEPIDADAQSLADWRATFAAIAHRPSWKAQAACRDMDTALFFVGRGQRSAEAEAACEVCPVVAECRAYALGQPEHHGRWGGLSERARRRIRKRPVDVPEAQRKAAS